MTKSVLGYTIPKSKSRQKSRPFCEHQVLKVYPADNCMFKVYYGDTRAMCKICSKLTIKITERRR